MSMNPIRKATVAVGILLAMAAWQEAFAREYDAVTGRFIQNEPLLEMRPFTSYTYAANNPVMNTDPTGLITILVHGTSASDALWWRSNGAFAMALDQALADPKKGIVGDIWKISTAGNISVSKVPSLASFGPDGMFQWTGGNSPKDRHDGAQKLANYIQAIRTAYPQEPIRVVAHSHGGNVAKEATSLGAKMDALVLLGTPHGQDLDDKGVANSYLYAPTAASLPNFVLNFYSEQDIVQETAATAVSGEKGNAHFFRTDRDPTLAGRYVNIAVETKMRAQNQAHSVLHSSAMAPVIASWIKSNGLMKGYQITKALPGVLTNDNGFGEQK
jgi:pimeloyl-ACP methyl ester carboxylesterase